MGDKAGPLTDEHSHLHERPEAHATPGPAHEHDHFGNLGELAERNQRRLLWVILGGITVMLIEIAGGVLANSLVLLADAAHYATDIVAVVLAFVAVRWATKVATKSKTFGYHRAEVVAAFLQAVGLWIVSIYFLIEAWHRIRDPQPVDGPVVFIVGAATLVANGWLAYFLQRGTGHNINMRAAYLHILSDVLGSAAALLAGALIYWRGWHIADPLLTVFITLLILGFTWRLSKQTLHILLEGSPLHVDPVAVAASLRDVPSVRDVHDLHVWTLTSGLDSVSAHVVLDAPPKDDRVSHEIHERLKSKFNIDHVTVQVESPDCPCTSMQHRWHVG